MINPQLGTVVVVRARNFKNPELIWKTSFYSLFSKSPRSILQTKSLVFMMLWIGWFDVNHLPEPIIPVVKVGIEKYLRSEMYGEFGCL